LKLPEAARGRRAVHTVDRRFVQTLRAQRHLKPCNLGAREARLRPRASEHAEERDHTNATPQGLGGFDGNRPTPRDVE
jgi:hypothetical protein